MVNAVNWPVFYGSQPGHERVDVDGEAAAEIGIHEAIYISRCATRAPNNSVYIDTPDGETVNYPTLLRSPTRGSLVEGGALMWTPGDQLSAVGR